MYPTQPMGTATLNRPRPYQRRDQEQGEGTKKKTVTAGDSSDGLPVDVVMHPSVQAEEDADDEKHACFHRRRTLKR